MVVNAEVFNQVQIGIETTPGTAVPANKLLTSTGIDLRPQGESQVFAPPGAKFDMVVAGTKLWSTGAISGIPTFQELCYILSTLFQGSVATASGVSTWTFISNVRGPDAIKTLTIEQGSNVAGSGDRAVAALARALSLVFDRDAGVSQTGEFMAKAFVEDITLTASPTQLVLQPITSPYVSVYLDRTNATALGTTQFPDFFHYEFACSNKAGQKWSLNRANGLTYAAPVELKPTIASRITLEKNDDSSSFMTQFKESTTAWMRIEVISPVHIGATVTPFSLTIDMAVGVERPEGFPNVGGVKAEEFTLRALFDGTWGNAFKIVVVNDLPSL